MRQHVRRTHYIQFGYSLSQHIGPIFQKPLSKEMCSSRGAAMEDRAPFLQSLSQLEFGPHSMVVIGRTATSSAHTERYGLTADMRRLHAEIPISVLGNDAQTEMGTS